MNKAVLLHICCAPCAVHPSARLREEGFSVQGYFYNPNIHPYREYRKRMSTVREFSARTGLPVLYREGYDLDEFLLRTAGKGPGRCEHCYRMRLDAAAAEAGGGELTGQRRLQGQCHCGAEAPLVSQGRELAVGRCVVAELPGDRDDPCGRGAAPHGACHQGRAVALDHRVEQLLAAADVPVDAGGGDAQLGRELAHGKLVDPLVLDDGERGVDDALTGHARPARGRGVTACRGTAVAARWDGCGSAHGASMAEPTGGRCLGPASM